MADNTKQVVVEQYKQYFYYKKTSQDPLSLQISQIKGSFDVLERQIAVFYLHLLCVNCINCFPFDLSSWEHLWSGIGAPKVFPSCHGCCFLSWKPHPSHFCFEMVVSWADKGVRCCQLACRPSCPSVLLQTPFKAWGEVWVAWCWAGAAPRLHAWRKDQAASARIAQGRLLGTVFQTPQMHWHNFSIVWDHIYDQSLTAGSALQRMGFTDNFREGESTGKLQFLPILVNWFSLSRSFRVDWYVLILRMCGSARILQIAINGEREGADCPTGK